MNIPEFVLTAIEKIELAGFSAYVVGGCVRDSLMGLPPHDWDITTSAAPGEIKQIFSDSPVIEVGISHGTVAVVLSNEPVEITTFRIDGEYLDNRRPQSVCFTNSLKEDLSRRDFTINAIAYGLNSGICDPFGGRDDIKSKTIRCVGNPQKRFTEDALRIMRALRFSAVLGFDIESETAKAIHNCRNLLKNIAFERINSELSKLLLSKNPLPVLRQFSDVFSVFIPEISSCVNFNQRNPHHCYSVWEHTIKAISKSERVLPIRLALLFHDLAKPLCAKADSNGILHFRGHPDLSCEIARSALNRLHCDNRTKHTVLMLVKLHDTPLAPDSVSVKKALRDLGEYNLRLLICVKLADNAAKASTPDSAKQRADIQAALKTLNKITELNECYSLKQLSVNGRDIIETKAVKPTAIGKVLSGLLEAVIEGKCENEKSALLSYLPNLLK